MKNKIFFLILTFFIVIFLFVSCKIINKYEDNNSNGEDFEECNIRVFYKSWIADDKILIYEGPDRQNLYGRIKSSKYSLFGDVVKTIIPEGIYYIEIVDKNITYSVANCFDVIEEGKKNFIIKCDVIPELRDYFIDYLIYGSESDDIRGLYKLNDIFRKKDGE